jgi:putative FmdB family regulatory protein
MPIYEFKCSKCEHITSVFVRSVNAELSPKCEACGGKKLERVMPRVARLRTVKDVQEEYSRPEDAYRDPRQIGSWVEQRFEEYGVEIPKETKDRIAAAREGEMPGPVDDL